MNAIKRNLFAPVTIACGAILLSTDAHAYIDPGTGTLLIQWLFGMAVASFAILRSRWDIAKAYFSSKSQDTASDADVDGEVNDTGSD